jgi:RNA polymerase sigma-70 factor (ECF subfamily)
MRSTPPPADRLTLAGAPDGSVVAEILRDNDAAAQELVRRFERPVYNLIVRMVRDPGTAEDLAQETFIKVFRSLHTFDAKLRFSAWILKIANNTAIDSLRRARPATVSLDDEGAGGAEWVPDPLALSPERAATRQQLAEAFEIALGRLRPEFSRVLVLRYQEDLDYDEIATVLDVPLGTVKTFLHRARHALARELAGMGWGAPSVETGSRPRP